ncbi:Uu.00g045450.m01.CDS01 [Anthostomella pinea]|uniref:Uu.00g045450.m01.CDS01 n=1 Tax=Anthostomella pinea TaxID=933095 RepID=A0AAI8YEF0_9PEZI|nr:Uu.00g045450.m01.CDS01 [Anthostomella pinea]
MDSLAADHAATYRQYKEDTESIAGWLALNSLKCGYIVAEPASSASASPTPSTRLKGKARKQARETSKASHSQVNDHWPKYAISVSDFSRMAKAIADFKPKEARTSHVKRQTHAASRSEEPDPLIKLVNRFSGLQVEHSSDQGPEIEPSSPVEQDENDYKLTDLVPVTLIKSEEDIEEDFFFPIFTFLQEVDDVRSMVRQGWSGYREGRTELIFCSLITNTAIQLVRRAEHELGLPIERPKKYPSSAYPAWNFPGIFIYENHQSSMIQNNVDLRSFLEPSPGVASLGCSHSELCLWETFTALKHSLWEAKPEAVNICCWEKRKTFRRIKSMLPCLQSISQGMAQSFASDGITSGIGAMFKTRSIPVWTAFGMEMLLDIQDELQTVPQKALKEVQRHTRTKISEFRSKKLDQQPFSVVPRRQNG